MDKKTKTKNIIKIVLRVLAFAVVGFFIGISVYTWNAQTFLGDPMPMPLGMGASVVLSGSMEPELSVDDLIIVKKTDKFYEKQVIVYRSGGSLVVHRIVEIKTNEETGVTEYICQGDANGNAKDPPITADAIKGEVIGAIPKVGQVVDVLQDPIFTIVLMLGAVALLIFSGRKEKQENDDELAKIKQEIALLSGETINEEQTETAKIAIEGEESGTSCHSEERMDSCHSEERSDEESDSTR